LEIPWIFFTARKMIPIDLWFFFFAFSEVLLWPLLELVMLLLLGGWWMVDGLF
jgi:hypothetical protein